MPVPPLFRLSEVSLLFQAICSRYAKGQSTILTSNKAFGDWGDVFAGDTVMASAALDGLLHRSTVVNIRGDSYRLKEKRLAGTAQRMPGTVAQKAPDENEEVQ